MAHEEHAVSLKLPTFWTSHPEVWFVQAEAQFELRRVTADETKYLYVLAALDQETAMRFLDLIRRPPNEDIYKALKDRLIDTFGLINKQTREGFSFAPLSPTRRLKTLCADGRDASAPRRPRSMSTL